jgi:CheY-like chemotaxis protein
MHDGTLHIESVLGTERLKPSSCGPSGLGWRGWRIPVIFITGHGTILLAIAAMKAGAFDFIEKPLREDAMLESIER